MVEIRPSGVTESFPDQQPDDGSEEPDRARLERKVLAHVQTLITRQLPDLAYAKGQFAVYDRKSFGESFDASTPEGRDSANRVAGAFDDVVNGLNEVLRNSYCLENGYRRVGPAMPVVYAGLPLAHADELEWINDARNDLTHDYPVAEANRIFDAVEELDRVISRTLRDIHRFANEQGLSIPGIDGKRGESITRRGPSRD
ncbi:MAG: hypothetical protein ACRDK4_07265 [Solirubrobacteraceae bacterium]